MDEDGFPKDDEYFEDFYALNEFIRNNADNPKYINNQMYYCFEENIDGEPGGFSWVDEIEWSVLSDEEIQFKIDDFIEFEKENEEECAKVDEFSKEIHYFDTGEDYKKKQYHLKDIAYVCPTCIRSVEDCRCPTYPYYLVQVDKLMVPIIRELNSKGYKTTGCCAGHPEEEEFKTTGLYIAFAEEYDFDEPFPEGGKYSKAKHIISYAPSDEDYKNLVDFQMDILDQLQDWAEMLFEVDYDLDFYEEAED
jgi:hypothetical protein